MSVKDLKWHDMVSITAHIVKNKIENGSRKNQAFIKIYSIEYSLVWILYIYLRKYYSNNIIFANTISVFVNVNFSRVFFFISEKPIHSTMSNENYQMH